MLPAGLPMVSQKTARVFSSISGARPGADHNLQRRPGSPRPAAIDGATAPPDRHTHNGDYSAYHPAILAAIRNAVLPEVEVAAWARDTSASVCDQVGGEVFFVSADTAGGR